MGVDWPSWWLSFTAEMQTYSDGGLTGLHLCWNVELTSSRLSWNTKLLRLKLVLKCNPEVYILKSSATITFSTERDLRVTLLMKHGTHVCIEMLSSRWNEACVWALSLVIFLDSLQNSLRSFWNLMVDWKGFWNTLYFILTWAFMIGLATFWNALSLILSGF